MRLRTILSTFAIFASLAILIVSPANATPKPGVDHSTAADYVYIINSKSELALQPTGSGNGAPLVQASADVDIIWNRIPDGSYRSFENEETRLNMGIDRASTSPGAAAIQANPAGHFNQDWTVVPRGSSGVSELRNRHSGLCLGISGASIEENAPALQFPCDGSLNQGWIIAPI
jgi:hypothetical protein